MSKITEVFGDHFPLVAMGTIVLAFAIGAAVQPESFTQILHDAFLAFAGAAGMRALPARKG